MDVNRCKQNPERTAKGIHVQWQRGRGMLLPEAGLALDPRRACGFAFVSHAHADHVARHRRILCSPATAMLMKHRFGLAKEAELLTPDWDQPLEFPGFSARLTPAGHIPGSAMLHLTRNHDGSSLLYTGDFKLGDTLVHEPCRPLPADCLILETTFGLPHFQFPPEADSVARLQQLARETLEEGEIPVLLGYSLGKAQAILTALTDSGLPLMLHKTVFDLTRCCEELGMTFPPYRMFDAATADGHVLVFPPNAVRSTALRRLKRTRLVMLSGWALTPGAKFRYQVDEVIPLSDHADHPDLLRMVEMVNPIQVWTVHGYASEFATELRRRGRQAWSLISGNQLEFDLIPPAPDEPRPPAAPAEAVAPPLAGPFAALAAVLETVANSSSRTRKLELLGNYLASLDDDDLEPAALWLTGRVLGRREQRRSMNLGWAIIRRALLAATGLGEAVYREVSRSQNDAGRTTYLLLTRRAKAADIRPWSLREVRSTLEQLRDLAAPAAKTAALADALEAMDPNSGSLLVRLLTGDLRIGLKEGLAEEAVARACGVDADAVREAHMLLGHLGQVARLARSNQLDSIGAEPMHPLSPMLASPESDAAAIWKRLLGDPLPDSENVRQTAAGSVWLEHKLDGIRAQLHRRGDDVALFSRDQRSIGHEFPEILRAARELAADLILDGEIIARSSDGKTTDFSALQHRLGRDRSTHADLFSEPVTVAFIAFDLLWHDGESLLRQPLLERRRRMENLGLPAHGNDDPNDESRQAARSAPPAIALLPVQRATDASAIESAFHHARRIGDEGLIAKDPASLYRPGRRGKSWLKLKKPFSTLDVVVVKAQQGHGKRAHLLSDYTFAILDDTQDALFTKDRLDPTAADQPLKVIGKAYSGLTDPELEFLTEHFKHQTVSIRGRVHTVIPDTILEVAFDSIQPSPRHNSGLALRFPRIVAIRPDKTIAEIDTLTHARTLAGLTRPEVSSPVRPR